VASVGNFWASGIYRARQPEASNLCRPRFFPEKQRDFSILRSRVAGPGKARVGASKGLVRESL